MSKCISSHGEFSEHEPDDGDEYTCKLCGAFDEDALRAEFGRAVAERDALYAAAKNVVDLTRRGGTSLLVGKSVAHLGQIIDHMPNYGGVIADLTPYREGGVVDLGSGEQINEPTVYVDLNTARITWNAQGLFTFEVLPKDDER